ncbi:S-layer homology domain-containing protein [Solibacillus sp. MA9]|uniref:S-layer homology domain-containing protein n=1 Tax=Solibacillus palustris TaxID=2908203 RepID=A0ABS9U8X2_9BACL|nr:S-layer homology domain-containing protein [Solibacillus sp. MA9]MCH7320595.1 S-layer homology domain-containing protein [Solibacillus sp. MA9]
MAKSNKGRKLFATTATAALVASAIVPVASAAQINDFNSISSYAQEAVQDLNDRGVIKGDQKGNFNPKNPITRAEAATILVGALELEGSGSTSFTDVKKSAWYYEAIDAAVSNGIFQGQGAGKFNPSANLTRSEAAIILVDAFGLEGSADLSEFKDSASVKSWAEEALSIAVANGVMKGDNGNLKPNAAISRQDFAVMYHRTEAAEGTEEVSGSVKAINSTTVEVTFPEAVTELNELNFAIEGLTISNKVLKQTDSKTVVLTTSAQTADVEYTVTVNGEAVGKFKGVSAVVPTAVKTVVASQQGIIGKEVTLTAEVTVADGQSKAGIPVTFNIVNGEKTNDKIEVVAHTNDKGVATYSYTRYYNGIDDVVAYATNKSSVKDNAKVYWASSPQLTIKEDKAGTTVANGGKKSYQITGDKNSVVLVAFEENLDIKSNKIADVQVTSAVGYIDEDDNYKPYSSSKKLTPYELSTGAAQYVVVELDKKGEGSLIITGNDASVTPIVYEAASIGDLDLKKLDTAQANLKKLDVEYSRTLLQAKADKVKFEQNDKLALDVKALGTEDAAQASALKTAGTEIDEKNDFGLGGREYEVTVRTKDGELASKGSKAHLVFEDIKGDIQVIIGDVVYNVEEDKVLSAPITVEKDGKASFRVIGKGKDSYATPTVFLNTEGSTTDVKLDKKDVQVKAETTYFTAADVEEAVIKVLNGEFGTEVTSLQAGKKAYAVYQSVDQNGFAYGTGKTYDVTFELSNTFGELEVTGKDVQNVGRTYTYETTSDVNGRAVVEFTSKSATTVSIDILGSRNVLPTKVATMKFTQYATGETTGVITATNTEDDTLTIGTNVYSYADAKEYKQNGSKINKSEFEKLIVKANARVSITKDADGKLTFDVLNAADPADVPVTVTSAEAVDTDGNNIADQIKLTFSKDVDEAVLTAAYLGAVTLTGGTVGTTVVADSNSKDNKVTLAVTGATGLGLGTLTMPALVDLGVDASDFAKYTTSLGTAVAPTLVAATSTPTPGTAVKQVETLTIDANAAVNTGDAIVTVKAAGFNGGAPLDINVRVEVGQDADTVAASVVKALKANSTVTGFFTVTGTADEVILTANTAAGDDSTMNIAIAGGSHNVVTGVAASVDTKAGELTAETVDVKITTGATNAGTVTATVTDGASSKTVTFQVAANDTANQVATKLAIALSADSRYVITQTALDTVTLTNKTAGTAPATTVTVK